MSTPTDPLADLLACAEAGAWQQRLTAGFFDPETRRSVIDEVRAWLASRDAAAHTETVLRHLVAAASRSATPPERESPAPLVSGAELEDRVITTYPYPIATPYRALTEQESATAAFGCLLDTFEALVHFLASTAVSAYVRGGLGDVDCNRQLLERLAREAWSVGDLWGLLRDTVRHGSDLRQRLPWPELVDHLLTASGKLTRSALVLESFVSLRNRVWGHGTGRDESLFSEVLAPSRSRLDEELARMDWLSSWDLVRPVAVEGDRVSAVDLLRGERRLKNRPFSLALDPADLDPEHGDARVERSLLLVAPDRQRYLPLYPLALFHFQQRAQGVYFLQRPQWRRERGQRRLRKAGYVAYESGLTAYEEGPGDPAARSLEGHVQRLEAQLTRQGVRAAEPPRSAEDIDHQLPEMGQELEFHRRTFAGRDDVMRRLLGWVAAEGEGGYVVLLGPPGQGKSALLAELSRRAGEMAGCVVHLIKSHRSPLRFLPALISQAARLAGVRLGEEAYAGDIDDLRNSLVRVLETLRQARGRAVLVLDALDELDGRYERLNFLPETLPQGVRAVLSCRPDIPLVQALRARLRRLEEWPLRPLSADDLFPILRKRLQAELGLEAAEAAGARLMAAVDWPGLFERLQGNPLFLQRAIDQVVRQLPGARVGLEAVPATLEALFQSIYNEIAEKDGTRYRRPEGRVKARLLHLFSLAREPLGFEALQGLLAADGQRISLEETRDRVWEMSPYLLEPAGQRFKPWHQGLADFVRASVLGEAGSREVEGLFAAWLRQPRHALGLYALRHRVRHLLRADLAGEAADLLLSRAFVEARAGEEPIHDLVSDLADVVRALPGDDPREGLLRLIEEALRTDLHFLARHHEALFGCLYNRGWWYDSPESARHYWPAEGVVPPWERNRPKLSALLDEWRAEKERLTPGFRWVRSLRPPEVHLGTAQRMVFRGHQAGVAAVTLAGQGRIASASEDRSVRVWDLAGGEELLCLTGHTHRVCGLAGSPDGRWLFSASDDRTIRVWDSHDGRELLVLVGHRGPVNSVACSADGRLLVSGGDDRSVRLWEAATGRHLACLRGHRRWVAGVCFSPDGSLAASASGDASIRLWHVSGGQEAGALTGHAGPVNVVVFTPDGASVVSAGDDGTIRFWDRVTRAERHCLRGHQRAVRCLGFAGNGRWLVSGGDDRDVVVWDLRGRRERSRLYGHEVAVRGVVALEETGQIVSAAGDGTLRLWDLTGGGQLLRRRGHTSWVTSVCFSPDGQWIASGSGDRTVRLTTLAGDQQRVLTGHTDRVWSVTFSADSKSVASGARDRTVRLWEVCTGRELIVCQGHADAVRGVAFSPDGSRLASGSKDGTVAVWDTGSGQRLASAGDGGSAVISVAFSPDGRHLAAGHLSGAVVVWDLATWEVLRRLDCEGDDVDALAFSPDGRLLATASLRWRVRVWGLDTGQCLRTIPGTADAAAVAAGAGRPWWAVGGRWQTSIEPAGGGEAVAHVPGTLHRLTTHPDGRTWAATHASFVELFTLEGD